ncbi:MAG: class I SAM-dependent methyltransferase [Nanoarchaeota archaeon]
MKQYNYSRIAKYYDIIELGGGEGPITSAFLDNIFRKNKIKTVLDMACGTGAQAIGLAEKGYHVTASDINRDMLGIAKKKAKSKKLDIKFCVGDIRTARLGKFDAVISMFNAIGHLSEKGFEKAIKNVSANLKDGGLFIFDIFNIDFMKSGGFVRDRFIDVATERKNLKFVRFNKNKMDLKSRILKINQDLYIQEGIRKPDIYKETWDMKVYSSDELKRILNRNGFRVLNICGLNGDKFVKNKTLNMVLISKKRG